jgi:arginine exporter protein ArgO
MTGWLIFISIVFIIVTVLGVTVADTKSEKTIATVAIIGCAFLVVASFSFNEYKITLSNLKTEYPILAEVMQEESLRNELNTLLEDKQVNDKRYIEIIEELK